MTGRDDGDERHPCRHRELLPLGDDGVDGLVGHHIAGGLMGVGAHQHGAGIGCGLQAARGVHDIAHGGVLAPGPDRTHQHLAGVDPDAHLDLVADIGRHACDGLLHAQPGADRPLGVVLVGDRRTEQGDDGIADHLVDPAAEGLDVEGQPLEAAVDQCLDLLRIHLLGERGEADEIGEQDGGDAALVAHHHELVSTRRAEPGGRRHLDSTLRTVHGFILRGGPDPTARLPRPRNSEAHPTSGS